MKEKEPEKQKRKVNGSKACRTRGGSSSSNNNNNEPRKGGSSAQQEKSQRQRFFPILDQVGLFKRCFDWDTILGSDNNSNKP